MAPYLIAIVDDDEPYITMMRELLEDEGYKTVYFMEGRIAFSHIQKCKPDLVILDLVMEQKDTGLSLLNTLRLDVATAQIPVIVCSAALQVIHDTEKQLRS